MTPPRFRREGARARADGMHRKVDAQGGFLTVLTRRWRQRRSQLEDVRFQFRFLGCIGVTAIMIVIVIAIIVER